MHFIVSCCSPSTTCGHASFSRRRYVAPLLPLIDGRHRPLFGRSLMVSGLLLTVPYFRRCLQSCASRPQLRKYSSTAPQTRYKNSSPRPPPQLLLPPVLPKAPAVHRRCNAQRFGGWCAPTRAKTGLMFREKQTFREKQGTGGKRSSRIPKPPAEERGTAKQQK